MPTLTKMWLQWVSSVRAEQPRSSWASTFERPAHVARTARVSVGLRPKRWRRCTMPRTPGQVPRMSAWIRSGCKRSTRSPQTSMPSLINRKRAAGGGATPLAKTMGCWGRTLARIVRAVAAASGGDTSSVKTTAASKDGVSGRNSSRDTKMQREPDCPRRAANGAKAVLSAPTTRQRSPETAAHTNSLDERGVPQDEASVAASEPEAVG
jgi:hypothetical protein